MKNAFYLTLRPEVPGIQDCLSNFRPAQTERLNALIKSHPALLEGAFYLRPTSANGVDFEQPGPDQPLGTGVIAWSRILGNQEVLCAINCDRQHYAVLYVTIDNDLHSVDSRMSCLFASDLCPSELNVEVRNGKSIRVTIPPDAMVIYA